MRHPWFRGRGRRGYNSAMTSFMSAALPAIATTHVYPSAEPIAGPPVGLTDADAERITAAIAAGRTESTRRTQSWNRWRKSNARSHARVAAGAS